MSLALQITDAGRLLIAAALDGVGPDVSLTDIAMGEGFGPVLQTQKLLRTPKIKVPISSAQTAPDGSHISLRAVVSSPAAVWVREVGIWAGDKLFAYYSAPTVDAPLYYLTASTEVVFAHDIYLESLDASSITIVVDPNASTLESLVRLHEQSTNPHGITEALATMLAAQAYTNQLILVNHYLDPLPASA